MWYKKEKKYKKGDKMKFEINIGISNRHVHLTEKTYQQLFDSPLTIAKNLSQPGGYASNQFVTIKTRDGKIEKVRIVGPHRNYNQIEISSSDAYILKINPPVRRSGDLKGAETVTIVGPKGEIELKESCILAQRHVHMSEKDANQLKLKDQDQVTVRINGDRAALLEAYIKTSLEGQVELHIDRDEANALLIKKDTKAILYKEKTK